MNFNRTAICRLAKTQNVTRSNALITAAEGTVSCRLVLCYFTEYHKDCSNG